MRIEVILDRIFRRNELPCFAVYIGDSGISIVHAYIMVILIACCIVVKLKIIAYIRVGAALLRLGDIHSVWIYLTLFAKLINALKLLVHIEVNKLTV